MSTLPIRIREVVRSDGTRSRSLLVFCPREEASIAPDICVRCAFRCPPEREGLAPAVGCAVEGEERADEGASNGLFYGAHPAAARIAAGVSSGRIVVCVQNDVPLIVAAGAIDSRRGCVALPVVDDQGVYLGTMRSVVAPPRGPGSLFLTAADAMVPGVAVRESDHLDDAIGTMTSHHLREVPIIDGKRRVVGVLTDLELLRWVARGAPVRWR